MLVYKQYDQVALDRQYNNRLHVPAYATHLERWKSLSSETQKCLDIVPDLSYGSHPRETLDIYPSPHTSSKTLVFIHGGYWYALGKEYFGFIADAFHRYHITCVLINYPLAPEATMDQVVASCRKAVSWIHHHIAAYNGNPADLFIAGYSAGAHLAAMQLTTDWTNFNCPSNFINGVCAISGLFNLVPIWLSDLNHVLLMDQDIAGRNSPLSLMPSGNCGLKIFVGECETEEFLEQSRELYAGWKEIISTSLSELPGLNHYSIIESILEPASDLHQGMLRLMKIS